jgi:endoglucanase
MIHRVLAFLFLAGALPTPLRVLLLMGFLAALFIAPLSSAAERTFDAAPETRAAADALPVLRVDGPHIVGPDGEPVRLRGLAFSDPHHLAEEGQWGRRYLEEAAAWGANLVRIPVHPARWRDVGADQYFEWLDEGVRWATELGLYVIIDWHTIGNPLTGVPHRPMYLTTREETFYFWHLVAFRYAGNATVAFYELFNEPTNRDGTMGPLTWAGHKTYMKELISMLCV